MKYMLKKMAQILRQVMNNAGANVNNSIAEAFIIKKMKGRMNYEQNKTGFTRENEKEIAQQLCVIRAFRDGCGDRPQRSDPQGRKGQTDGS